VFHIIAAYFDEEVSKLVCCNEVSVMAKKLNKLFYASANIRFCCLITGLLINWCDWTGSTNSFYCCTG